MSIFLGLLVLTLGCSHNWNIPVYGHSYSSYRRAYSDILLVALVCKNLISANARNDPQSPDITKNLPATYTFLLIIFCVTFRLL